MFDTNVFNRILDGYIHIEDFIGQANFYVTHIQLDELNNTPNSERKDNLIRVFHQVSGDNVPTESFVLGVSRLGMAKLGDQNGLYGQIVSSLNQKNGS